MYVNGIFTILQSYFITKNEKKQEERKEIMTRHARLTEGKVYRNRNGGDYLCRIVLRDGAILVNTASGWQLEAHTITRYDDGTIEWDYSTGGHFE